MFNDDDEARGRRGKETSVAHDDDDLPEDDDEEGVEADYDEVLTSGVSIQLNIYIYCVHTCTDGHRCS